MGPCVYHVGGMSVCMWVLPVDAGVRGAGRDTG